jgi:FixJ family two-component response regulator
MGNSEHDIWDNLPLHTPAVYKRMGRTSAVMNSDDPIIFVVDDDYRMQEALSSLIAAMGFRVATFGSASEFLKAEKPDSPACLILDLELPDIHGLELQQELADNAPPVIFVTGHGDIPSSVRAMKSGAVEFLSKPFDEQELQSAIETAIDMDRLARQNRSEMAELQRRYSLLTHREQEVLPFVVEGFLNKQTAADLGTSEVTIRVHRGHIIRKMGARSLAELVRMADKLGAAPRGGSSG